MVVDGDSGRAELVSGLTGPGEADLACRFALQAGATFSVSTARVSVAELVTIYRRRVQGMQKRGVTTIGSDTVVARLEAFEGETVRLSSVNSADSHFVVFLDDETKPVSCLGVRAVPPIGTGPGQTGS